MKADTHVVAGQGAPAPKRQIAKIAVPVKFPKLALEECVPIMQPIEVSLNQL